MLLISTKTEKSSNNMCSISIFKLFIVNECDIMYRNKKILSKNTMYLHVNITYCGGGGNVNEHVDGARYFACNTLH